MLGPRPGGCKDGQYLMQSPLIRINPDRIAGHASRALGIVSRMQQLARVNGMRGARRNERGGRIARANCVSNATATGPACVLDPTRNCRRASTVSAAWKLRCRNCRSGAVGPSAVTGPGIWQAGCCSDRVETQSHLATRHAAHRSSTDGEGGGWRPWDQSGPAIQPP